METCPECGQEIRVMPDGSLFVHSTLDGARCAGSGRAS
jgi:hypothetical protein